MATSTWSLWAAVFRPLVIGIGAGLIVALLLYVLGVSYVWLMTAIAGGLDVENRTGNDACAEGTGLPSNSLGVPNGGVEGLPLHTAHAHATAWPDLEKNIAEVGESADQPGPWSMLMFQLKKRRPEMQFVKTCCTRSLSVCDPSKETYGAVKRLSGARTKSVEIEYFFAITRVEHGVVFRHIMQWKGATIG